MNSTLLRTSLTLAGLATCGSSLYAQFPEDDKVVLPSSSPFSSSTEVQDPFGASTPARTEASGTDGDDEPVRSTIEQQKPETRMFSLQRADAVSTVDLLTQLDGGVSTIVADARTNMIICIGLPDKLQMIESLLEKLDQMESSPATSRAASPATDPFSAVRAALAGPAETDRTGTTEAADPERLRSTPGLAASRHSEDSEIEQNIEALRIQYQDIDQTTHALAARIRQFASSNSATDTEQVRQLEAQLSQAVATAFETRQQLQRLQMYRLQRQLDSIRQSVNARDRIRDAIIQRRIEDLRSPETSWNPQGQSLRTSAARSVQSAGVPDDAADIAAEIGSGVNSLRPAPFDSERSRPDRTEGSLPMEELYSGHDEEAQLPGPSNRSTDSARVTGSSSLPPGPQAIRETQDFSPSGFLRMIREGRERLVTLEREQAQWQGTRSSLGASLGNGHPRMRQLEAQLADVARRIENEQAYLNSLVSDLKTELVVREAQTKKASARLEGAKRDAEQMKQLYRQGAVPDNQFRLAEQQVNVFEQELVEAEARLNQYRRLMQMLPNATHESSNPSGSESESTDDPRTPPTGEEEPETAPESDNDSPEKNQSDFSPK